MNLSKGQRIVFILTISGLLTLVMIVTATRLGRAAGPWYVASEGDDGNDCLSPGAACATINGAIGKASAGDTIYVAIGTYTGTGDEAVLLDKDATLSGGWDETFTVQSGSSTIDGEGSRRGITVDDGVTTTVERFNIRNGYGSEGGGICNYHGTLTLNDSVVSENTAGNYGGGIANGNTLTLNNTTVRDNTAMSHGGISSFGGTVILNYSAVRDNTGNGIRNDNGALTLNGTSVSGNEGNGIFNGDLDSVTVNSSSISDNLGSGIENSGGTVMLNNSTISGNKASGIYNHYYWHHGIVYLDSCTVTNNTATEGGGIYSTGGTVTMQNTIIAGNTAGSGPDCSGTIGTAGYNLLGDISGCNFGAGTGDLVYADAKLGLLIAAPGIPKYHPLLAGSLAIDHIPSGTNGCGTTVTTDQRGVSRPQGTACDTGAYEYVVPGPASDIYAVGGTPQIAAPDSAFSVPLQVLVLDNIGSPVNAASVTFSAPASGPSGIFTETGTHTTTAVTDESGVTTAAEFIANEVVGSYVVTATVGGVVTPAVFLLYNTPGWYVAPDGDDDNFCVIAGAACATINGVLTKAVFAAGDTVLVASGTYTGTGDVVVLLDKDATLSGGWDDAFTTQAGMATIDGEGARRGIAVNVGVTATVDRFTMQNGRTGGDGGGIYIGGILTLINSIVSGNTANDDGGGIHNEGSLTLKMSTVSANTANDGGGGIYNQEGTLTLVNSTVSGNTSGWRGGGIFNGGTLTLFSGTISGNAASDGGGGIDNGGSAILQNGILAANTASGADSDCHGDPLSTLGYNLIGSTDGCDFTPGTGDLTDVRANLGGLIGVPDAPRYHPLLADSPAIDAGNPGGCRDHVGNLLDTDQRGADRVGRCDIGAYEYTIPGPAASIHAFGGTPQTTPPLSAFGMPLQAAVLDSIGSPVNNAAVTFFAPPSGASGTFADSGSVTTTAGTTEGGIATAAVFTANELEGRYMVTATVGGVVDPASFLLSNSGWYVGQGGNDANDCQTAATPCATVNGALGKAAFSAGDTVLVAIGTYTGIGAEVVLLDKSVRLLGGWNSTFTTQSGTSTVDGEESRRGITVNSHVTAAIERFAVWNGAADSGGGISNSGALTLNSNIVSGNTASGDGGGINNSGTLGLNSSTVSGNTADSGGGIFTIAGTVTLDNSSVSDNTAGWRGGGFIIWGQSTAIVNNSTVSGNTAGYGGGILNYGTLALSNSIVSSNDVSGITNYGGNAALNNSTVNGNAGGGISTDGTFTLNNSTICDNSSGGVSNAVFSALILINSTVSGNTGSGISNDGILTLNNSTISGNAAERGGGIHNSTYGTSTLQNTIVAGNTASLTGPDCSGTIGSAGYNLVGNTSDCAFTPTTGDQMDVDARLFPLLGLPWYHPLLTGSPAIDGGNPAGCTDHLGEPLDTDQRGSPRPIDGDGDGDAICDIGSYEVDPENYPLTAVYLPIILRAH